MTLPFNSRRSTVHSTKGIACSTQPLASAAGIKILENGGNAADAAIAMAAAMGVTEPMMTGIGGDVFCLYYDKKTNSVSGFNGSGKSGSGVTFAEARASTTGNHVPPGSGLAVTVPGAAAGWCDFIKSHGSKSLDEILAPAIKLAEEGFPVSQICANMWSGAVPNILKVNNGGQELLIDGKAPVDGQLWTNKPLAEVYRKLAANGRSAFYEGEIAEKIVAAVAKSGGKLTLEDLKNHESLHLEPITMPVNEDVSLHELPPNNHGLVALIAVGIVNELHESGKINLKEIKHNSPEYVHMIAEVLKFAFKDADHYVGDPHESKVDIDKLLSPQFIKSRAQLFNAGSVNEQYEHGAIDPENKSDTSYFTVADKEGNACSIIASVYHSFGSCIVPQGTGFPLHNRGCNFNLREGSINAFGPNKRPYHTIIPAMLTRKDSLYASYGVMGAFMQPQGHLQVALNMVYFGMDAQAAIDAPRICIAPNPDDSTIPCTEKIIIYLENGIDTTVADKLRELGHTVKFLEGFQRSLFGRGQIIRYEPQDGRLVYHAGSDPRGDGCAIPEL